MLILSSYCENPGQIKLTFSGEISICDKFGRTEYYLAMQAFFFVGINSHCSKPCSCLDKNSRITLLFCSILFVSKQSLVLILISITMQFSQSTILSIATLMAVISAENVLVALNSDIKSNVQQYLSYVQENTQANVAPLLSLYQQAQTYTDESYTTLVNSDELASISSFAQELPWYSSRILPELQVSETTTQETASETTTQESSPSETSSVVPTTSSEHTSSEHTSSEHTSSEHTSSEEHSSTKTVSSTAGAALIAPGVGLLALGAIALL